jgi:hypothetical protein
MMHVVAELRHIVELYTIKINLLSEDELTVSPQPSKWTKKEVVGHLIDSAQANLRRFICAQYENTPPKIVYDQNFWVMANHYNHVKTEDLVTLWKLINQRIADVLTTMPTENYSRECDTNTRSVELHTLEWLAADYVKHMKHHLNQILTGSFPVTYP